MGQINLSYVSGVVSAQKKKKVCKEKGSDDLALSHHDLLMDLMYIVRKREESKMTPSLCSSKIGVAMN